MLGPVKNVFKIKDLRRKILTTFFILLIFRLLAHIPIPGADVSALRQFFSSNELLGALSMFTGGAAENFSIVTLGVGPYINASIIFQLLTMVSKKLEELSREGESGREAINRYTKYLTVPLTILQSYGVYFLLNRQGVVGTLSKVDILILIISMTAGTMLLVWLGDLITEYGIGNGISVIIFANIIDRIPLSFGQTLASVPTQGYFSLIIFLIIAALVIAGIVYINEAERAIPISYARVVRRGAGATALKTNLPIKLNQAGVIPIFFAVSLVFLPSLAGNYLVSVQNENLVRFGSILQEYFTPGSSIYNLTYFAMVFGFTYFYTAVQFNPDKIADDLKRRGGFVPGIRPGRNTSEYINNIVTRTTFFGALFLGLIAVLPTLVQGVTNVTTLTIGGTGLLIVVSVIIETVRKVESQMLMRDYGSFLE